MLLSRFLQLSPDSGIWRLVTTEETAKRREFNIWALTETGVAILCCLAFAIYFETFGQLIVSIAFVPLFFLRSNAAIRLGVFAFQHGFFPQRWPNDDPLKKKLEQKLILVWSVLGGVVALAGTSAFFHFVPDLGIIGTRSNLAEGLIGFFSIVVLLVLIEATAGAFAATIAGAPIAIASTAAASLVIAAAAILVESFLLLSNPIVQAWALGAGAASALLCAADLLVAVIDGPKKIALLVVASAITASPGSLRGNGRAELDRIAARWPSNFFVGLVFTSVMLCLSIWLCSLLVRLGASARYFRRGFSEMPGNIIRLSLCTSPFHTPEMLPGLPNNHNYSFRMLIEVGKREIRSPQFQFRMAALPFLVFGFVVWRLTGWFYRFFLKSTLWLWWPLLILGGYPNHYDDLDDMRINVLETDVSSAKWYAAICLFITQFFNLYFQPFITSLLSDTPILPMVVPLIFFSFTSLMSLLLLVTCALIIGIHLEANRILANSTRRAFDTARPLRRLNYFAKLHRALGFFTLFLYVIYLLFYANSTRWRLPINNWLSDVLRWLYGGYANALIA